MSVLHWLLAFVKVKVTLEQARKVQRWGRDIALLFLLTSALGGGVGVVSTTSRPLYPLEGPVTHSMGGWVGHRAGLDKCGKSSPPHPPGLDPRTFHPAASRYTD